MINVSNAIKQAYSISNTQVDRIILNGTAYRISNVIYEDDCYEDGNIFGTAIARFIEFDIEPNVDLEKKEFEYQTGLLIDGTYHWISLGNFIVYEIEESDDKKFIKVQAMDYMLKSNIPYSSDLHYTTQSISLLDVAQEACRKAGLILGTTNFTNYDFVVDSNQFEEGALIKDVFKAIAEISGTFAKIKPNNRLYFISPKHSNVEHEILTPNDYSELNLKRHTHPINLVSLGMTNVEGENVVLKDEESIAQDGENVLKINDNPFAYTQYKRQLLIGPLFETVKGFEYTAYELKGQAKFYEEVGDEISIIDLEGNIRNSFLFRFTYKSPNGLESEMSAPSITKASVAYQNGLDAINRLKRTEFLVNKQDQKIQGIVEEIDGQNGLSERMSLIEMDNRSIHEQISVSTDITTTLKGQGVLIGTGINASQPIKLLIRPTGEDITPLYPKVGLYPRVGLYPHRREIVFQQTNHEDGVVPIRVEYNLPDNLYYLNEETYDEFYLEYENGICQITKKVDVTVNSDGSVTKTALATPLIVNYEYPTIDLVDGDYEISMPGNLSAYVEVQLMLQNMYTKQFATHTELRNTRTMLENQTTEEIERVINYADGAIETLDNKTTSTFDSFEREISQTYETKGHAENLSSRISQTVKSIALTVNNNNTTAGIIITLQNEDGTTNRLSGTINMTGLVKFTDLSGNGTTTINGANIQTGTISSDKINTSTLTLDNTSHNLRTKITAGGISELAGLVGSPSGGNANPIIYFGAFNQSAMYSPLLSVGAMFWENGEVYIRRLYCESGRSSAEYMGYIKTPLSTSSQLQAINYVLGSTSGGTRGLNVNTYAEAYDIYAAVSDENLKKNIEDTTVNALDIINLIRHIEFDWKESGEHQILGFSAQQLQSLNEDFVSSVKQPENAEFKEILQVRDFNILPYVTKAIQELSQENKELKEQLKEQQKKIDEILERLEAIEK